MTEHHPAAHFTAQPQPSSPEHPSPDTSHSSPGTQQPEHARGTLPAFTPVGRKVLRSNGWTPEVQRRFVEALADTGSVNAACRRVGRSDHGAYALRRHPDAASFRASWEAALALGIQRIEDVAMDRALNGVEVPVYSYGRLVGSRRVYNDRLLMFMLRNRAPDRFAGGKAQGLSAVDQTKLKRLKEEWREELMIEYGMDKPEEEVIASIDAMIDRMKADHDSYKSPKTLALEAVYLASVAEDKEKGHRWWKDPRNPHYEGGPLDEPQWYERGEEDTGEEDTGEKDSGPALPLREANEPEAEDPAKSNGPRIRSMKDDGW